MSTAAPLPTSRREKTASSRRLTTGFSSSRLGAGHTTLPSTERRTGMESRSISRAASARTTASASSNRDGKNPFNQCEEEPETIQEPPTVSAADLLTMETPGKVDGPGRTVEWIMREQLRAYMNVELSGIGDSDMPMVSSNTKHQANPFTAHRAALQTVSACGAGGRVITQQHVSDVSQLIVLHRYQRQGDPLSSSRASGQRQGVAAQPGRLSRHH